MHCFPSNNFLRNFKLQDFVLSKFSVKSSDGAFAPFWVTVPSFSEPGRNRPDSSFHGFLQVVHLHQKNFSEWGWLHFSLLTHLLTLHKPNDKLLRIDLHSHHPLKHVQKVIFLPTSTLKHQKHVVILRALYYF